jgi:CRISPR-associated endonuclease/helicase Cas3
MMTFEQFFTTATRDAARLGVAPPYYYQCRLACGEKQAADSREAWLERGTICASKLIEIPTGLGKTAAVVLAWLWNRVQPNSDARAEWPRRLVYCLPMRALVEQTAEEVRKWITNLLTTADELGLSPTGKQSLAWLAKHSPTILMGGEDTGDWDIHPEQGAILIGTQDMLLSRALNRGYGMSRYRWPMHFGLLNNDALWVMDETQLMGVTVETSAQLDGFRSDPKWKTMGGCPTWWMSATLDKARLVTVDHDKPENGWPREALSETERTSGRAAELFAAKKSVSRCSLELSPDTKSTYSRQLAEFIAARHQALIETHHPAGTLTLVVVNSVRRAQEIYAALTAPEKKNRLLCNAAKVALVHSRFRRKDRAKHEELLFGKGDRIIVATQAVEAGVDVSARSLITELAPWSSLVQRIGRCNRRAEYADAEVFWIDINTDAKGELLLPYSGAQLAQARVALTALEDASSASLGAVRIEEGKVIRPVLRRRDLVDLFDNTPDLCGQDLDVSRYIRDGEDSDVQFFWRDLSDRGEEGEETDGVPLDDDELCRVSVGDAAKFVKSDKVRAFIWDPLNRKWTATKRVRPGAVYLIASASGGYSENGGWTGDVKDKLGNCPAGSPPREAYDKDRLSFIRHWHELAAHTSEVVAETDKLTASLQLDEPTSTLLRTAAQWHDVGKAHDFFQFLLRDGPQVPPNPQALYAKSENPQRRGGASKKRRGFRHELASALAWLLHGPEDKPERDLIAYLIAAHHGKVRLSIRALPDEKGPGENCEQPFARGVWHDDLLPAVALPGVVGEPMRLDLSFMRMGEGEHGPSWLARMIALRDRLGPFRLAYLETLLRAADGRASGATECRTPVSLAPAESSAVVREDPVEEWDSVPKLTPEQRALVDELVADGLEIQHKFKPEPLYKLTGKRHYEGDTAAEIRQARRREKGE